MSELQSRDSMHHYINRAIGHVIGDRVIDYAGIALERDDGSYNSLAEYYVEACVRVAVFMHEDRETANEETLASFLVEIFKAHGIESYLTDYYKE